MCKGLFGRDWGELVGKEMCFFPLEDRKTPVTLLQSFSPSTLLPKTTSGQKHPGSLCLPLGSFQAGMKRAAGSTGLWASFPCQRHV